MVFTVHVGCCRELPYLLTSRYCDGMSLEQRCDLAPPPQERLDFSCAMFGPDGGLVANAPHIPVHLGAMQEAVQYQVCGGGGRWRCEGGVGIYMCECVL